MMSPILRNVIRAVTKPIKQLAMTTLLGVILVYMFTIIGFHALYEVCMPFLVFL